MNSTLSQINKTEDDNQHSGGGKTKSPIGWVMVVAAISCVVGVTIPAIANLKINPAPQTQNRINGEATEIKPDETGSYIHAFEWAARVKLEELGIHHSLKVGSTADGKIEIRGKLSERLVGRYELFKSWYKSNPGFPEITDSVERVSALHDAAPKLKSVWFKEPAKAFFDDGSSGVVGEKTSNGWQILKISETEIVMQKHGNIVSIDY